MYLWIFSSDYNAWLFTFDLNESGKYKNLSVI